MEGNTLSLGVNDVSEDILRCLDGSGGLRAIEVAWRLGEVARVDKGRGTRCFAEISLALMAMQGKGLLTFTNGFYFTVKQE